MKFCKSLIDMNNKTYLSLPFCLLFSLFLSISTTSIVMASTDAAYHYSGEINFEPEHGNIDVQWTISVHDPKATHLTYVLRSSLGKVQATGDAIDSVAVGASESGDDFQQIAITLKPSTKNELRSFDLSYSGVLLPTPMGNRINQISKDSIELNVDSFWLPMDSRFNQLLTVDLQIGISSDWQAVGAGDIATTENGYQLTNTKPSIDIAFALAKNFVVTKLSGFTLYDVRQNKFGIDKLSSAADFCVTELNQRYGQSGSLSDISFTINDRPESGYARGNYIALTDISEAQPENLTQFVCHEIAHNWSGYGKFDTEENWLNEGFAEYVGLMMLRKRFGDDAFKARLEQFRAQIEGKSLGPIWTPELTARPDYLVSYRKAPLVLQELEKRIGSEPFDRFVTAYMTSRTSTTESLLENLTQHTDKSNVEWFVNLLAQ